MAVFILGECRLRPKRTMRTWFNFGGSRWISKPPVLTAIHPTLKSQILPDSFESSEFLEGF